MVAADERVRSVDASLVFADISGFTALNERLMRGGREGAEVMVEVLDQIFGPLLDEAARWGGDLLKFGGDALLFLLSGDGHLERAAQLVDAVQRVFATGARHASGLDGVRLGISIGMETGPVTLLSCGASRRELVVAGPTLDSTLAAESAATSGQVLLGPTAAAGLDPRVVGSNDSWAELRAAPGVDPAPFGPRTVIDLARALDPQLVEHLRGGEHVADHRRVAAAFVGFRVDPARWATGNPGYLFDLIDPFIRLVERVAADRQLTLITADSGTCGGKCLLVAGAPRSFGDNIERAMAASREIVDAVATAGLEVTVSAGVNQGVVFAGSIGTGQTRAYCITGDTVNVAARIAGVAPPGDVLCAAGAISRVRHGFAFDAAPSFRAKGKRSEVQVVSVRLQEAAPAELRDDRPQGRDRELGRITGTWARVEAGASSLIDVVGVAGMGKSRLVNHAVSRLDSGSLLVVSGFGHDQRRPFAALAAGLRRLAFGPVKADGLRLSQLVDRHAPHLDRWLPLLGLAFGLDVATNRAVEDLAPEFRELQLRRAVVELIAAIAPRPLLVVVEDAQWLDDSSAGVLDHLATAHLGYTLVVVSRRPDGSGWVPPGAEVDESIDLQELEPVAAAALVRALPGGEHIDPHRLRELIGRSGGNPLFLVSLAELVVGGGTELPESVEEALRAEFDRLPARLRLEVGLAAVLGVEGERSLADRLVSADGRARLAGANSFLEVDGDHFCFTHALRREVAYLSLSFSRRRAAHAAAATALGERDDPPAELLSLHTWEARDFEQAWEWSRRAAASARRSLSPTAEIDFLARAAAAGERTGRAQDADFREVLEQWGDALEVVGRYEQAQIVFRRAAAGADDADRARLFTRVARQCELTGEFGRGVRWARRAERLATQVDRRARIEPLRQLGALAFRRGDLAVSLERYRDAAEIAAAVGDRRQAAEARRMIGTILELEGRSGIGDLASASRSLESAGFHQRAASALINLGAAHYDRGRWDEAVEAYERCGLGATKVGDLVLAATAENNVAEIMSDRGHLTRSMTIFREAEAVWTSCGYSIGTAVARSNLGRALRRSGDVDAALAELEAAEALFAEMGAADFVAEVLLRRAECALARDEPAIAAEVLEQCRSMGDMGGPVLTARLRLTALAALHEDRDDDFRALIGEARETAKRLGMRYQRLLAEDALVSSGLTRAASLVTRVRSECERLRIVDTGQRDLLPASRSS